jgi:hypothetical protein
MTASDLKKGGRYNWKNQKERLIYLGKYRGWHQFSKVEHPREVWCEVLDDQVEEHFEETTIATSQP